MNLNVDTNIGSINIKTYFESDLCIFCGNSGTGKTYLFSLLADYYKTDLGLNVIRINEVGESVKNKNTLIDMCSGNDIVIFDRADLYITPEVVEGVRQNGAKLVLISIKNYGFTSKLRDFKLYRIVPENNRTCLVVKKEYA